MVFESLAVDDEDEEDSFFLVTTVSTVFFFTLSLLTFTLSVFTLAFAFGVFSFFVLSTGGFDVDLVEGLGTLELLEGGALETAAPTGGLEEMGGVLLCEGISSIGSSLTGVASPRSIDCRDCSDSSVFFFLTFLDLRTLVLDFVPDEEEDGGWCGRLPLSSLPLLPLACGE